MQELVVNLNVYLEVKDGETREETMKRLLQIFYDIPMKENIYCGTMTVVNDKGSV